MKSSHGHSDVSNGSVSWAWDRAGASRRRKSSIFEVLRVVAAREPHGSIQ